MTKIKVVLQNAAGLHARPASMFVKEAGKYESKLTVRKGDKVVDPKKIMGILILGAQKGDEIEISAEGNDEEMAVQGLKALVENNFGE